VHNYDWPSRSGLGAKSQKAQLVSLLDKAQALRLNAIVLQVRPAGDAAYASALEPWTPYLSGRMGVSPGYDPLEFAIAEAHARGLELHAWFNPFRAAASADTVLSAAHFARQHPDCVRSYGGQKWFDPGDPRVREHALKIIADVARRYDVDGIHIDDYFYPYPVKDRSGAKIPFPDDATHAAYGRGQDREDWRRDNINAFVRQLYTTVKSVRPAAKVGISPFGIYRPGVPDGIEAQLDPFREIGTDSRLWLQKGWCDYFTPQLYWRIDPPAQSFRSLVAWWARQNTSRRHLWPGIATERIDSSVDPGRPASEMIRQIALTRGSHSAGSAGHCHWSIKALTQNRGGINSLLLKECYQEKALVPACPWLGKDPPAKPSARMERSTSGGGAIVLKWSPDPAVRFWSVQIRQAGRWSLFAVLPKSRESLTLPGDCDAAAIRGISPSGVASQPAAFRTNK
jgi:uncharacterized lipoprotein YddW (UPF0748 family)